MFNARVVLLRCRLAQSKIFFVFFTAGSWRTQKRHPLLAQ